MAAQIIKERRVLPPQLWIGLGLVAIFWPLNWLLDGLRTHLLFFPLWTGYALAVDGLVWRRKGTSLLTRNWKAYVGLFFVSMPVWWLFEALNLRSQNWFYDGREYFTFLQYFALATLSFSTVIPAVFGTAELWSTAPFIQRMKPWLVIKPTHGVAWGFFIAGCVMLGLLMAWPRYFFPFMWLWAFFVTAPLNIWLGNRTIGNYTGVGDWRPIVALFLGGLTCGFFWEFWNFWSFPKWIYVVPYVDFLHIFEMPILGYGGYLPFSLELFSVYHLINGLLGGKLDDYIEL